MNPQDQRRALLTRQPGNRRPHADRAFLFQETLGWRLGPRVDVLPRQGSSVGGILALTRFRQTLTPIR